MAGISRTLRNMLLIAGVGGAAATAGAWYVGLDTFRAEDGAPGITFVLPPDERHHVIFDWTSVEHKTYKEGRLVYQGVCGLINPDGGEKSLGCVEREYP